MLTTRAQGIIAFLVMALALGCDALSYFPEDCADELLCPGDPCPGQCVPLAPLGFDGPALLWIGPESQAPECPARAPRKVYEGHGGLNASHECPPCECSEPTCVLPEGIVTSTLNVCPNDGPGATLTDFDAPPAWDGSCAAPPPVDPSLLGSLTIQPATERPCGPVPPEVAHDIGPIGWGLFARGCLGEAIDSVCSDPGTTCLPSAEPPPPGFRQCIMHLLPDDGSGVLCPAEYPEMHAFYGSVDDERACTECVCTQTAPSTCLARLSAYTDGACSSPLFENMPIGTANSPCIDVMPGLQLGSIAATWQTDQPGSCQTSGGEPIGQVKAKDPRTFCCQPAPGG